MISRIRVFFFFNDTATTEIYTLSLHDALPILRICSCSRAENRLPVRKVSAPFVLVTCPSCPLWARSEEHTSELQSRQYLVCRLLLEKKKHGPATRQQPRRSNRPLSQPCSRICT